MAVWALLSISQTGKATNTYFVRGAFGDGAWPALNSGLAMTSKGNDTYVLEYTSLQDGEYRFRFTGDDFENEMCPTQASFDLTLAHPSYTVFYTNQDGKADNYFYVNMKSGKTYTFTFDNSNPSNRTVACTVSGEGSGTVTPTEKYCSFYLIGNLNKDSEWANGTKNNPFTTTDGKKYTYTFTGVAKTVYFRVQGYGSDGNKFGDDLAPNATKDKALTTNFEDVKYEPYSSAKAWTIDAKSDKTYTITLLYNGTASMPQIKYSDGSGNVTPPTPSGENPIANRKYSEGYYLVGNFFNFDGADINYKDAVFKFQQVSADKDGNAIYSVEIPATLTAKAQVMSVDATGTPSAVYGPGRALPINNTYPEVGADHTATTGVFDFIAVR